jgi:hypothetical protein
MHAPEYSLKKKHMKQALSIKADKVEVDEVARDAKASIQSLHKVWHR